MHTAVTVNQRHHPKENGADRWVRIFRALKSPHKLNKIIMDSSKMNLDWARRAVSETKKVNVEDRWRVHKTRGHLPRMTRHPARAPAHGDRPN